jgi:hypothetical protein
MFQVSVNSCAPHSQSNFSKGFRRDCRVAQNRFGGETNGFRMTAKRTTFLLSTRISHRSPDDVDFALNNLTVQAADAVDEYTYCKPVRNAMNMLLFTRLRRGSTTATGQTAHETGPGPVEYVILFLHRLC